MSSPGDTLQYFLLVLVQTNGERRVSSAANLDLVHLHLSHTELLQKQRPEQKVKDEKQAPPFRPAGVV